VYAIIFADFIDWTGDFMSSQYLHARIIYKRNITTVKDLRKQDKETNVKSQKIIKKTQLILLYMLLLS